MINFCSHCFKKILIVCTHGCMYAIVTWCIGGQRTTLEELVLTFCHVGPRIKLRSSYLMANTLSCGATSLAPTCPPYWNSMGLKIISMCGWK